MSNNTLMEDQNIRMFCVDQANRMNGPHPREAEVIKAARMVYAFITEKTVEVKPGDSIE